MTAAHYLKHGTTDRVARVGRVPLPPPPSEGQLLVRVHAASLNPADFKSADGEQAALLNFTWPRIYGFDFSGEVAALGPGCPEALSVGDNVFGMIQGLPELHRGTCAEYALVEASICAHKPNSVSHQEAASIPLVAITAVKGLRACGLSEHLLEGPGPRVLVLGGAGGVGSVAIQLAKSMFHASFVATTASSGHKTELVRGLGADLVVDYRRDRFEEVLQCGEHPELFDAVLVTTPGEAKRAVQLLKPGGGMTTIIGNATVDAIRTWLQESQTDHRRITTGVRPFLMSSAGGGILNAVEGSRGLRKACSARGAQYAHVIGTGDGQIMSTVAALMERGAVRAVVDTVYPLRLCVDGLQQLQGGRVAGKVVIAVVEEQDGSAGAESAGLPEE